MSTQQILLTVLLIGLVVLLLRIAINEIRTLFIFSRQEGFQSGSKAINTQTTCPSGTQMFMYEGRAYCCDGRIDSDAPTLSGTCKPASSAPNAKAIFCSLGPSSTVPNCAEVRSQQHESEANSVCPPSMPNLVNNGTTKHCCAGPTNAEQTACLLENSPSCIVAGTANEFAGGPTSCEFLKAKEQLNCPDGWGTFTHPGQGSLQGLTVFGCSDNKQMCYSTATIQRLQELGFSTDGMNACKL